MNATKVRTLALPKKPLGGGLLSNKKEPTINELLAEDPNAYFANQTGQERDALIERFGNYTADELNKVIAAESFSPKLDKVQTSPDLVQGVTSGKPGSIKNVDIALADSAKTRDLLRAAVLGGNKAGIPSSVIKKDAQEPREPEVVSTPAEAQAEAPEPLLAAPPVPSPAPPEPAKAVEVVSDPLGDIRALYEKVKASNAAVTGGERKLNRSVNLDPEMVDLIPLLCDRWTQQAGFKVSMANLMRKYIKEGLERDCEHFIGTGGKGA